MYRIYASLVIKGLKDPATVPDRDKMAVKAELIRLERADLAELVV